MLTRRAAAGLIAGVLAVATGGATLLAAAILAALAQTDPAAPSLLVTVGATSDRSAVVWARAAGPGAVQLELTPVAGGGIRRLTGLAGAETDFTVKLAVADLAPGARHAYRVAWRGEAVSGEFVTAPAPSVAASVTLLWSGDLGGGGRCRSPAEGYPIFHAMKARRPDLFLFVGDTIYADQRCRPPDNVPGADFQAADLAGFRQKHRYNRADPAVQEFFRTTSVEAIWDDHEVRNDFAGPSEPLMPAGRRAFLEYWPIAPPPDAPARLHRRLRWGRLLEVFVLDTRQYRSPNTTPDGPGKTMLGTAQRDWLVAAVAGSDATWKAVVSTVPLSIPTGRSARDSWARWRLASAPGGTGNGFEGELSGIVGALRDRSVQNLVWLVADVHHAEVIRYAPSPGLVFHELVAGPLRASWGRSGVLSPTLRPTRLYGEGGFDNFGELTVTEGGLLVRIIDAAGQLRFETLLAPAR